MSRRHAATQLLRLGPLSLGEFVTITGWPYKTARQTISRLLETGHIYYLGTRPHGVYGAYQ